MLVAPGVWLIRAPNPSLMTGPGTNSYLLGENELAVIDPGPALDEHCENLLDVAGSIGGQIRTLLLTHGHADHAGAAAELRRRTGAALLGPPGIPEVDQVLVGGEMIAVGRRTLRSYATPGHADHHLCFWLEEARVLFTGDLVAGAGTVVLSESPGALQRYLDSLQAMRALGPAILAPGHGPLVADGLAKIEEYLAHRAQRDQQILQTLRASPATVEELVLRVYATTPPALHPLAARNVRAHLRRLQEQGRAAQVGQSWQLVQGTRSD